jgi:hypothetical protein
MPREIGKVRREPNSQQFIAFTAVLACFVADSRFKHFPNVSASGNLGIRQRLLVIRYSLLRGRVWRARAKTQRNLEKRGASSQMCDFRIPASLPISARKSKLSTSDFSFTTFINVDARCAGPEDGPLSSIKLGSKDVIMGVMAKITKVNPHVNTAAKRNAATSRLVRQSSAIEGIEITQKDLVPPKSASKPARTTSPRKKGQ